MSKATVIFLSVMVFIMALTFMGPEIKQYFDIRYEEKDDVVLSQRTS